MLFADNRIPFLYFCGDGDDGNQKSRNDPQIDMKIQCLPYILHHKNVHWYQQQQESFCAPSTEDSCITVS